MFTVEIALQNSDLIIVHRHDTRESAEQDANEVRQIIENSPCSDFESVEICER